MFNEYSWINSITCLTLELTTKPDGRTPKQRIEQKYQNGGCDSLGTRTIVQKRKTSNSPFKTSIY